MHGDFFSNIKKKAAQKMNSLLKYDQSILIR